MKTIELTLENGDPIMLALDHIVAVAPRKTGASITPSTVFTILVRESYTDILAKIARYR